MDSAKFSQIRKNQIWLSSAWTGKTIGIMPQIVFCVLAHNTAVLSSQNTIFTDLCLF